MPCLACIERQAIIDKARAEGKSMLEIAKLVAEHAFGWNQDARERVARENAKLKD